MKYIKEACINMPAMLTKEIQFLNWFNSANSINESISSGFTDFFFKIFSDKLCKITGKPSDLTCCEIGFGGGRLLIPACFTFKHVTGIDIHNSFKTVEDRLHTFGIENFTLLRENEIQSKVTDKSFDFVYSFITFQHFDSIDTIYQYFQFISRTLKKNGNGIIYFGINDLSSDDYIIIDKRQDLDFPRTLFVNESFIIDTLNKYGLETFESGVSTKNAWSKQLSSQFYIKFKKI